MSFLFPTSLMPCCCQGSLCAARGGRNASGDVKRAALGTVPRWLQRGKFLPAISLLEQTNEIVNLDHELTIGCGLGAGRALSLPARESG